MTFVSSPEHEALFARGWPYLRVLTDEVVSPAQARKLAKKGLEVVDPFFATHIPRDVARRYLGGYIVADPYGDKAGVKAALADEISDIEDCWLREILEVKLGPSPRANRRGETYDFRLAEVMFLFEAFLGTEVVVEMLVEHLVAAREHPSWWGDEFFQDHSHSTARRLVPVLGWMRLRMEPARWREAIAPLAGAAPKLPKFQSDLDNLLDDSSPLETVRNAEWIAMQRRDHRWLAAYLEQYSGFGYWKDPQMYYVMGVEALARQPRDKLTRLPKWWQLRVIDEFGVIAGPEVCDVIRALLPSRSAKEAAAAWLEAHGEGVAPA